MLFTTNSSSYLLPDSPPSPYPPNSVSFLKKFNNPFPSIYATHRVLCVGTSTGADSTYKEPRP